MADLNGVMMQYFHWYTPADGTLWTDLAHHARDLAARGITSVWLPPAYKGFGGANDVGYAAYDLFDLGEFDQKGSVRTKYGTREEFLAACTAARAAGIRVYADAVFNHRMGGDAQESVEAVPLNPENRNEAEGGVETIQAWTHFSFPGRQGAHSPMEWHWQHFQAVDHAGADGYRVYLFKGKDFATTVDAEKGNYDFLMGCDVDMDHEEVVGNLQFWGEWFVRETGVDGFRFDAAKHVKAEFFRDWMATVSARTGADLFGVAEYWSYDVETLEQFIAVTDGRVSLFDAPLHLRFHQAGAAGRDYDLRTIFEGTLVQSLPMHAVTLVDNHDSQPLQALESPVASWFKPHAYALILLRRHGYPCVFHADYYGAAYSDRGRDGNVYDIVIDSHRDVIDALLQVRRDAAYGDETDYFDHPNCIGWTRSGDELHPGGIAVVLSNSAPGSKWMQLGSPGTAFHDVTGHVADDVIANAHGWAEFRCHAASVSVWRPTRSEVQSG